MRFKAFLQETASGGSIGAGSIAANPSGDSRRETKSKENEWRSHAIISRAERTGNTDDKQEQYHSFAKNKLKALKDKKKKKFSSFFFGKVNEDFDMADVVSRLKAADTETIGSDTGVVSYGVEDDKGNFMKITVRADQAKEFEETLAKRLADNKTNTSNGISLKGNSLAEILYDLRDKFEIINVDFPQIPKDVVYNPDLASKNAEPDTINDFDDFDSNFDYFGNPNNFNQDELSNLGSDFENADGMDLDMNNTSDEQNLDLGNGEGQPPEQSNSTNPEEPEGENVTDFGEEPAAPEDEGSILNQIVSMLKAQANAEEAKADAAAEEARAKQAEWSAIAADKEVHRQEELARVEAEVQAQKKKEKEAKKYADLARYNVQKANNKSDTLESKTSFLSDVINILKEDQFDNVQTLQKQKLQLRTKYQIQSTDDQETQNWKRMMFQFENTELDARIKAAQVTAQYQAAEAKKQQQTQQNNQQQPTNQPPTQPANQGSTPQPNTPQVPNGNGNQAGQ